MGEFNSDDHYIYHCGQESLRRKGVALIVKERVWNAALGCSLKSDRTIFVHFQGKPFNITIIQVYAPTTNAKVAVLEQCYKHLQDLLELTPKKRGKKSCPLHHRGLEYKSRKSRDTWSNRQVWPWSTEWSRAKAKEFCQKNTLVRANPLFQQHKRWFYTWIDPCPPLMKVTL